MIKKLIIILVLALSFSCEEKRNVEEQLNSISGYWEIEKVEISQDSARTYTTNPNVDYFEIEDKKGFRKKVKPKLDGTYTVTDDSEKIVAKIEDDSIRLYYSTPYAHWKETVISAGNNKMSIKNKDGMIYHYRRFTPLLSNEDDEKE